MPISEMVVSGAAVYDHQQLTSDVNLLVYTVGVESLHEAWPLLGG